MASETKIEWCDATFNPWIGCTKVSPACAHCYAENSTRARVLRAGGNETWGKGAARSRTSAANWREPLKWNRDSMAAKLKHEIDHDQALRRGENPPYSPLRNPRVFCASLADWLDDEVPIEWFVNLLETIHATPHLDWLLLTKRPENFQSRMDAAFQFGELKNDRHIAFINALGAWSQAEREFAVAWDNVWIGTTVENQDCADTRIPLLLEIPAKVRFLSCEPLLGPVNFTSVFGHLSSSQIPDGPTRGWLGLHWVICGGESGPKARPMNPEWARSLRDQCQAAGVPFLFKQWGEWRHADSPQHGLEMFKSGTPKVTQIQGDPLMFYKVGKHASGRLLDGREWNEFPTSI